MGSVENVLKAYFEELGKRPYHSNLSWENCYKFFLENHDEIVKADEKSNLLEIAALQLGFYLASWGMYRGSAFIRRYDHNVFKKLIIKLLTDCKNLWNKDVKWEDLEKANNIISKYFSELKINDSSKNNEKYKNKPSQTLITKILMGIFGCVPAYDRYVLRALKEIGLKQTYSNESYEELVEWWDKQKYNENVLETNLIYLKMKLADVYLWCEGKRLEEQDKLNKEQT